MNNHCNRKCNNIFNKRKSKANSSQNTKITLIYVLEAETRT